MQAIEIIVIIAVALIFIAVIGSFIYKKIHHLPTGECADCSKRMKHAVKQMQHDLNKNK